MGHTYGGNTKARPQLSCDVTGARAIGMRAHALGFTREQCPFRGGAAGDIQLRRWQEGWDAAARGAPVPAVEYVQ